MKVGTILIGIAMAVALSACSMQAATLDSDSIKQSESTTMNNLSAAAPNEQNRGKVTDLPTNVQKEEKKAHKAHIEPITLYEVDVNEFSKKTSEIPSYNKGEITFWTDGETKSFNEGHNVTWGDPLVCTFTRITNLIPQDYLPDPAIDEQLSKVQGSTTNKTVTLTTATGISFTKQPYDEVTGATVVEVKVPNWGGYTVTLKSGHDSDIQIIQKITFQPETENPMKGHITLLDLDESWFAKKTSQILSYSKGSSLYFEQAAVDSHNQGHSVPWSDPLVQAMLGIANLIPYDYLQDKAIDQQLSDRKETITTSNGIVFTPKYKSFQDRPALVEVKVPSFGTYLVTMNSGTDSGIAIIQKIVLKRNEGD